MQSQNRCDPNYLLQINAFHRFTESNFLPPNARLLWFSLIDLCNACGWPEWFQVDANRLLHWIGAKNIKSAYRARDELVKAGLLEYEKGCRGRPNRYRLLYFPVRDCAVTAKTYQIKDEKPNGTQDGTQSGTQDGTQNGTQYGPNDGHINKQEINETKQKEREYVGRADAQARDRVEYAEIMDLFNRICTSLPQVQTLNDRRRQAIRAASGTVADYGGWDKLFETVQRSDFLTGRSGAWSGCGFDWILKSANLVKIIEGNYTDTAKQKERLVLGSHINTGRVL